MPELPEVETTLRGIRTPILNQRISQIVIRHTHLRWPIPIEINEILQGLRVLDVKRRAKYLLFRFTAGTLILHLGMSGRIRLLSTWEAPKKHDHVDIIFNNKQYLRFTDPRRFGALLFTTDDPDNHPLLSHIGPEPLTPAFNGDYLWENASGRSAPVKTFIMDSKIVAGVGNIYATEALFDAAVLPRRAAGKVTRAQYHAIANAIKAVLKKAIKKGGTTLKDFTRSDGAPGYFSVELKAYGREGEACMRCGTTLKMTRIGQRSTVYCGKCQK